MAVKVIMGKINDGIKQCLKDEVITSLSEKEEARLISLGVAERIPEVVKIKEVSPYAGKTADELVEVIESIDSEEELKAVYEFEQNGKNRKTVFQAIEARAEALFKDDHDSRDNDNQDPNKQVEDGTEISFNPDDLIK